MRRPGFEAVTMFLATWDTWIRHEGSREAGTKNSVRAHFGKPTTLLWQSVGEFVERAVQMLHDEETLLVGDRQLIHEKIERAFGQFECGEGLSPEEPRTRLHKQKTA